MAKAKNHILPPLSSPSASPLPADYYLTNLQRLLTHVAGLYDDLLSEQERRWLTDFASLPADAQKLYTRLLMRKGPLFRSDRLSYPEISDIEQAARSLQSKHWLVINPSVPSQELLTLFTRAELTRWFPVPGPGKPKLRSDLDAAIQAQFDDQVIAETVLRHTAWYSLLRAETLPVFQYLFFGNSHQDLAEFVMSDLGIVRYEPYPLARAQRFFHSRERLDTLLTLAAIKRSFYESATPLQYQDILQMVEALPHPGNDTYLKRKTDQVRNLLARQLERIGDPASALELYQQSGYPPARERSARILAKSGDIKQALATCLAMQEHPQDDDEAEFAAQFSARLHKQRRARNVIPELTRQERIQMTRPDSPSPYVEEMVAKHYRQQGWHAAHLENSLFNGLLGLQFWDIIFAPVPDAFFNPFQRGPRDLFSPEFRRARASAIESRLQELETPAWRERVLDIAKQKRDTANHLVNWPVLTDDLLSSITTTIPGKHLCVTFDRMLNNLGFFRNGFPDLLLTNSAGEYRLVEVKGPGDKLQANQLRWLRFFDTQGIPAQVTWLTWQDATPDE